MEAPRRPRRDRPPLRRSIRLEDDDAAADERRRVFGRGPRAPSFDEGDASDEHDECECIRASLERSLLSGEAPDDDEDDYEPELVSPPMFLERLPAPPSRAASSERALAGRDAPTRTHSQGVFERRLPRIYKFGLMDRSKRASSSALYERTDERSPTEAFYNATGSTRLSSQELFEKFCSEEFTSLYGREDPRCRKPPYSKSTGSSGSDVRGERCCRRAPCGSHPTLSRRRACGTAPQSDRSTDSDDASPRPLPLDADGLEDCSRSAPLLSPDRFEARFTFDISERSEVTSNRDETPSDATETRNLTLYEEPHSDRTSICDLYDAAFSSQRPSFRRDGSHRRGAGAVDLSMLDFRPIDDESPRASRRTSQRSLDETLRQNSDSRSWASDSVFATPKRSAPDASPSSGGTRGCGESPRAESTVADTTVAEEEQPSVIERAEYALALRLGRIYLDDDDSERLASTPAGGSARLSSRPSMHKLEPIEPEQLCTNIGRSGTSDGDASSIRSGAASARCKRGASEPPRRSTRCFPL